MKHAAILNVGGDTAVVLGENSSLDVRYLPTEVVTASVRLDGSRITGYGFTTDEALEDLRIEVRKLAIY